MKFLTKLGQALLKAGQIVAGVTPTLTEAFPGSSGVLQVTSQDLAQVADAIMKMESIGAVLGLGGADKLRAIAPMVAQVILQSTLVRGKQIQDVALFQQGVEKIAAGVADVLNSLDASGVQTTSLTS